MGLLRLRYMKVYQIPHVFNGEYHWHSPSWCDPNQQHHMDIWRSSNSEWWISRIIRATFWWTKHIKCSHKIGLRGMETLCVWYVRALIGRNNALHFARRNNSRPFPFSFMAPRITSSILRVEVSAFTCPLIRPILYVLYRRHDFWNYARFEVGKPKTKHGK